MSSGEEERGARGRKARREEAKRGEKERLEDEAELRAGCEEDRMKSGDCPLPTPPL